MGRINRGQQRKIELRERAAEITEERAKRTAQEQLDLLDLRLGKDAGAVRERKRLHNLLEDSKSAQKEKKGKKEKK